MLGAAMGDAGWGSWDAHSRLPKYGRPPQHPGSSQSAVPSWERRFCTSVCLIPWGRICAAKASFSAYKNIVDWDDAAAFESFQNAKARYWADINGIPCNIPLPDPNLYIDKVDHKAVIDPKLVEDLEKQQPPLLPDGKNEGRNYQDSSNFVDKPITATGWGNAEDGNAADHHSVNWDKFIEQPRISPGWDNADNCPSGNVDSSDAWNCHGGWGDATVQDSYWQGGGNYNSWNNGNNKLWNNGIDPSWGQHCNNVNNEQGRRNGRKRHGTHYDSRFSKSRQMNSYKPNRNNWNDCTEGNVGDYPYEKTMRGGQPMAMRQSKSRWTCGPVNHQRSAESGRACYWEKSVN